MSVKDRTQNSGPMNTIGAKIERKAQHLKERTSDSLTETQVQMDMASEIAMELAEEKAAPARQWIDDNVENDWVASQASGSVTQLVVVGATLIVGIIVYAKIQESTPAPQNSDLNNSSNSVTDTVASSFDLAGVLPIVIIAGAILFYLRGFGGMGGGGGRR